MYIENSSPLVSDPRDQKRYYFEETLTRRAIIAMLRLLFGLLATRENNGTENMPSSGPVVLAANHLTNFDVVPVQLGISRPIFFMGKSELFKNPLMDMSLRRLGGFPVHRGMGDQWAIRHGEKVLQHDQVLGIFPEGKRSKGIGLQEGKTGAAQLALSAGCAIVPVGVCGTERMLKKAGSRTRVKVIYGEPIWPKRHESPRELTDRMMQCIAALLPPELQGVYR